ncbi:MAG TPA: tetratricopeptide repeat protein [Thermoanaerobaculia bacterium]|jgi:tetratricopeptide (TPR) repeat protein
MTPVRTLTFLALLFIAAAAQASWYDDYDAGIAAARAGNWSTVVSKMNAAIKGNAKEGSKTRTYGAIFINYKPYYYRGVANLNLGNYEQAISDFERTEGRGEVDLGSLETLMGRAKSRLEATQTPAPTQQPDPTPPPVQRPVPQQQQPNVVPAPPPSQAPVTPSVDPALRQRAAQALSAARQRITAAQQRRAVTTEATRVWAQANARNASARSNDDFNAVIAEAENAGMLADSAVAPNVAATPPPPSRQQSATDAVLGDYERELRDALSNYFAGDFDESTRKFQSLTRKLPNNAWVWAFLGASQYSQYAFEADEEFRRAALQSFQRAKSLRSWKGGLPPKYFSRRIRRAFDNTAG